MRHFNYTFQLCIEMFILLGLIESLIGLGDDQQHALREII